jgi:hypothetical protein
MRPSDSRLAHVLAHVDSSRADRYRAELADR